MSGIFDPWREWIAALPAGVPIALSDYGGSSLSGTPVGVNAGAGAQLNADKLSSPFQRAMLIDGIHFRADTQGPHFSQDMALSVLVRVSVGPFSLTDDMVAPAGLAVREQYNQGEFSGDAAGGAVLGFKANRVSDGPGSHYTWRFGEPLFVPSGLPLRVTVRRQSDARDDYVYVNGAAPPNGSGLVATAFGCYFDAPVQAPRGMLMPVPCALTFVDSTVPAAGNAATARVTSAELSFVNRWGTVMYADKLIGRLPTRDVLTGGAKSYTIGENSSPETTVRIVRTYAVHGRDGARDAFGLTSNRGIVDPSKPFNAVFDAQSRSLDLTGMRIPPGDGLQISVQKLPFNFSAPSSNQRVYPVLGLIGVRPERWA